MENTNTSDLQKARRASFIEYFATLRRGPKARFWVYLEGGRCLASDLTHREAVRFLRTLDPSLDVNVCSRLGDMNIIE